MSLEVRNVCWQSSSQLTLISGVSNKASGCGKSGTALVGKCHLLGCGQPVTMLQVPVSWMFVCGVCREQGLGFISPDMEMMNGN